MENPKSRGKSALHWENAKARECLDERNKNNLLLAELIREYLDFYKLDYSKQIFMPESNLGTKAESSNEDLAEKAGMRLDDVDQKKPLLLQILEQYKAGGGAADPGLYGGSKSNASPDTGQGVQFSEEKNSKSIAPLSIGEGILGKERTPTISETKKTEAEKHLDKANSLLDELSREEKSGFKAEIGLNSGS